jgi:hypothetical protein
MGRSRWEYGRIKDHKEVGFTSLRIWTIVSSPSIVTVKPIHFTVKGYEKTV